MEQLNIELDKDFQNRPLDDQFNILLHKKLIGKTGTAKRAAKKYYKDLYKKNESNL